MRDLLCAILMMIGSAFVLLAGVGILRMPDLFMRMSSTAKAGTLGVGLLLAAAAVYFNDIAVTSRAIATMVFVFLTTPVAAHLIGRAAYDTGVPLWDGTQFDELRGRVPPNSETEPSTADTRPEILDQSQPLLPGRADEP